MDQIKADIITSIRLYTETEAGRRTSTPQRQHSCIFVYGQENYDCRLLLDEVGQLSPGAQATVPIKFLAPELIVPRLKSGDTFKLRELRFIADGVVDQVLGG